jgi:serine/threonine-protein kinase
MPLSSGARLGPYQIEAAIGAGGMGEVYKARDTRLDRTVAIKVLPPDVSADTTARARLLREARLASKLNHPHICTIYDVGEAPSTSSGQAVTYIGMELVEGPSLADRLEGGALPVAEAIRYGQQLAGALAHAHARGVVHRDFKSANVVLTAEGQVKVLDFGLAKQLAVSEPAAATTLAPPSLTEAGVVAGTLAYMAPEQLLGRPADARSDIWALGVVLYELVAGQRPFEGKTGFELSSAILNLPTPAEPASVPAPLAAVIDRCLAKEPGERYQRADEVRAVLDAVASGQAVAGPTSTRGRQRLPRGLVASVTGVVLIVAALGVALDVGGLRSRLTGGPPAARSVRLAVLPFANVSGDAEQEYLSDGLTTEMIALLGGLFPDSLRVIARTTAMSYKKSNKPIAQIGRELGVEYVLEGSARREAGRIRVTADLIKVADQTQLWAGRLEREMAGILALQNDVARQVAKALALKLPSAEEARLAGARAVDPEVYDLCLKGKELIGRFSKADVDAAEQYFQRALAKDPASAVAYAGIADVWLYRRQLNLAPPREAGEKGRAAALEAVALDDNLATAHQSLAALYTWTDFDFPAAEREFKRTLELDPNNSLARAMYAQLLLILQRRDEAMPQVERAVAIDPLDVNVRIQCAAALGLARRYDEALEQANQALRLQPGHPGALGWSFVLRHMKRQYAEAVVAATAYYRSIGLADVAAALERAYADSGYTAALRQAADLELAKHGSEPGVVMDAAQTYGMAGDRARALDLLERTYAERDSQLPYIGSIPFFDFLRSEPRFQALLRQMQLPE